MWPVPGQRVPQGLPVQTARPGPLDPPVPQGQPVLTAMMANEGPWAEPAHRVPQDPPDPPDLLALTVKMVIPAEPVYRVE